MTPEEYEEFLQEQEQQSQRELFGVQETVPRRREEGVIETPRRREYDPVKATTDDVSVVGDAFKGLVSGVVIGVPEGLATLGFGLYDYLADGDSLEYVDSTAQLLRDRLGVNPETQVGEMAELLGLFATSAIPVIGWMNTASKVARGTQALGTAGTAFGRSAQAFGNTRAGKALLAGEGSGQVTRRLYDLKRGLTTTGATATADFMIAPDGVSTMADHFDALPESLRTEEDMGFTGREEVARRMRNKLRIAGESLGIGIGVDLALPVAGATIGGLGMAVGAASPAIAPVTGVIGKGFDILAEQADKVPVVNPTNFRKYFTTAGLLEKELSEQILDTGSQVSGVTKIAAKQLSNFDKELRNTISRLPLYGKGKEAYQAGYDDLIKFLDGDLDALSAYKPEVQKAAERLATARNSLSATIYDQLSTAYKNGLIQPEIRDGQEIRSAKQIYEGLRKAFEQREGAYLRRMYTGGIDRKNLKNIQQTEKFKTAVDEVEEAMKGMRDPEFQKLDREGKLRTYAEQYVLDNIVKDRVGITARPRLDDLSADASESVSKQAEKSANEMRGGQRIFGEAVPLFKVSEDLLKSRSAIIEASPMLRELMGEVKTGRDGAISRYMQTMTDMAGIAGSNKLYNDLLDNPNITGTLSDIGEGRLPLILKNEDMAEIKAGAPDTSKTIDPAYVEVPTAQNTVFGGQFGSLAGHHVRKELFDALTTRPIARTALGEMWALGIQAKGASQIAKTVFSTMAQVRNYASGVFFATANGHMPRAGDIFDSISVASGKMANMREKDFEEFFDLAMRNGLLEDSVLLKEMQNTLRGTLREAERNGKRVISYGEKMTEAAKKIPGAEATAKTLGAPIRGLQTSYAFADNLWKMNSFISERGRYAAALRNSVLDETGQATIKASDWDAIAPDLIAQGVAKRQTNAQGDKFFDVWTADIVKDVMPVYSRIPAIAKMAARFPLAGNFVGFSAEIIRNSFNIVRQGSAEISFRATDNMIEKMGEKAAKRLQREINAIGAKRLAGYVTTAAGVSPAIAAGASAALGITAEEMEGLDILKPYFYEGQVMVPLTKPKDGKMQYMPISYYAPYDSAVAPAKAALEAYSRGEKIGKSELQKLADGGFTFIGKLAQPFVEEALLSERIADVVSVAGFGRGGRRRTGAEIYEPTDNPGEKFVKSMQHILGAMNPSIIDNFVTIKPGQGLVPGRITRAADDTPGAYGQDFNIYEEVMANTLGARSLELDAKTQIEFGSSAYAKFRNSGPASEIRRAFGRNDATFDSIISAYTDANQDLFRLQQEMFLDFEAAKALGLSNTQIRKKAKGRGIGAKDVSQILKGEFQPLTIGNNIVREARKAEREGEGRLIPARDLKRLRSELNRFGRSKFKGLSLEQPFPTVREREPRKPVSSIPTPPTTTAVRPPVTPITPVVTPPVQGRSAINPGLLGDNPVEIQRNLELAQRTRSG